MPVPTENEAARRAATRSDPAQGQLPPLTAVDNISWMGPTRKEIPTRGPPGPPPEPPQQVADRLRSRIMSVNFRELEEGLTRLESVDAARVVNQGERITEVHIIAAAEKPAKQVVRDVQSLAMARFGVNIDHRVISVVQISPHDVVLAATARAALTRISETPNGTRTTIEVTLRHEDSENVGQATGPAVASARLRLVGDATIDAIEKTFASMPPIALDSVTATKVGTRDVVVAIVVTAGLRGGEDLNVGSAISSGNHDDAAVKAVLNALNRRIANSVE